MTSREVRALDTMTQIAAYIRLRIQERDAAIAQLLDSIEADRRKLLKWMLLRDRRELPRTQMPGANE